jgi:hypothetical protein
VTAAVEDAAGETPASIRAVTCAPSLRPHCQREIVPVAAFVVGLEGVAANRKNGAIGQVRNGTICRLGSVGSRRVILGFAGTSKSGNAF